MIRKAVVHVLCGFYHHFNNPRSTVQPEIDAEPETLLPSNNNDNNNDNDNNNNNSNNNNNNNNNNNDR